MCELFGICSGERYQINDYLMEFFSHSNEHPHGWGLACMEDNHVSVEKEPVQATKSNYLKERLSIPIMQKTAFAHIRYATIGNVEYRNCHPYTMKDISGRQWTLVHNGTIFEYAPLNAYVGIQKGDTDSERILYHIVNLMNQMARKLQRNLEKEERFHLLDSMIVKMSKRNKLNLMLYDGELFYVHTNYRDSLYQLEQENKIIFSTTPLGKENWNPVAFAVLQAYEEGSRTFQGTEHGNEYVENEEDMKFLYSIFSHL